MRRVRSASGLAEDRGGAESPIASGDNEDSAKRASAELSASACVSALRKTKASQSAALAGNRSRGSNGNERPALSISTPIGSASRRCLLAATSKAVLFASKEPKPWKAKLPEDFTPSVDG